MTKLTNKERNQAFSLALNVGAVALTVIGLCISDTNCLIAACAAFLNAIYWLQA